MHPMILPVSLAIFWLCCCAAAGWQLGGPY
jgi:hypothetical protein